MAKKPLSEVMRQTVVERAGGCCEYCLGQEKFATHRFSIDHIIPVHLGGSDEPDNLALACQGCNNFKYDLIHAVDPETRVRVPLFHPRQDAWAEHFSWNENYTIIIGISPTGRATVQRLQLNRDMLINQRAVYRAYGIHPPK